MAIPSTRDVPTFDLDSLVVSSQNGAVMFRDTLLQCRTFDNAANESTLTFTISLADPKAVDVVPEAEVKFKGRLYRVRGITEKEDYSSGQGTIEVFCERRWYNLLYAGQVDRTTFSAATATECMQYALQGTHWTIGTIDTNAVMSWDLEESTVLGAIQKIAALYRLQLVMDEVYQEVHLLAHAGRDRGTYFTYERGINAITRRVDTTSLVTRIYGRNEDGTTIASVNNGLTYIEDYTFTREKRVAVYDFKSGVTAQSMLNYLKGFLSERSKPRISYEYSVSGLDQREYEIERFEVFDIVFIMDKEYDKSIKSRIVALDIDWINLQDSKITLENSLSSLSSSVSASTSVDPGKTSGDPQNTIKVPEKVKGLVLSSYGYWYEGTPYSHIDAEWNEVNISTVGEPVGVDYFEVAVSDGKTFRANSNYIGIDGIDVGKATTVRVRAVSEAGVAGAWSNAVGIETAYPQEPVYPPTKLALEAVNGVVNVVWDGKVVVDGVPKAATRQINYVQVQESVSGTDTWRNVGVLHAGGDTLTVPIPVDEIGSTRLYRGLSVDSLDTVSEAGESNSVVTRSEVKEMVDKALSDADKALLQVSGLEPKVNNTVTGTSFEYAVSTSATTPPVLGWTSETITRQNDEYVWMRTKVTYANGNTQTTGAVMITGNSGPQGVAGADGEEAKYVWIKYADTALGAGISNDPTGKAYIGFAYNKEVSTESTNPADYTWSLIKGEDGAQGPSGKDGKTMYTWIKYSDYENGASPYDLPKTTTKYIGIATNKTTATESTNPADYVWSKFRGEDGAQGIQGVKGADGKDGNPTYTWIKYSSSSTGSPLQHNPDSTTTHIGIAANKTTATESTNPADYTWSLFKGADGVAGADGADGRTLYTWIRYADTATGTNMSNSPTGKAYIGIAVNKTAATESIVASEYTWSLIKGKDGAAGVSISSVQRYYIRATSKPVTPTVAAPSGWSTTEPEFNATKPLYYADKVTYSNNTFSWTPVNLSGADTGIGMALEAAASASAQAMAVESLTENIVFNGSYELGVEGWQGGAQFLKTNRELAFDGENYITLTQSQYLYNDGKYLRPVTVGDVYELRARVRLTPGTTAPTAGNFTLGSRIRGHNNSLGWSARGTIEATELTNEWTRLTVRYTIPDSVASISAFPLARDLSEGASIDVDGIEMRNITNIYNAERDIITAQATADGKNVIFTQTGTPTAKSKGDQWWVINSSGNITGVRIWNGSSWVARSIMADSILVPSSVGTVSIADGAVTAKKVTADSALISKIFTDTLVAGKISSAMFSTSAAFSSTGVTVNRTGVTINTSSNKITLTASDGLKAVNSSGVTTFWLNPNGTAQFAGNITSGATITGATIKTAASGTRLELVNNVLTGYTSSKRTMLLDSTGLKTYTTSGGLSAEVSSNGFYAYRSDGSLSFWLNRRGLAFFNEESLNVGGLGTYVNLDTLANVTELYTGTGELEIADIVKGLNLFSYTSKGRYYPSLKSDVKWYTGPKNTDWGSTYLSFGYVNIGGFNCPGIWFDGAEGPKKSGIFFSNSDIYFVGPKNTHVKMTSMLSKLGFSGWA